MRKRFLVLLLVFVLILPYPAMAAVEKNETVYGLLTNDGTVKEVRVVNWAYGTPDGETWTDYGSYREVDNSSSDIKPRAAGNHLSWPSKAFKEKGLFYQGLTDKELPFKVVIDYTLNGKPIKPEQLAGKDGKLKIDIHLENLTKERFGFLYQGQQGKQLTAEETLYTPFVFQVSTALHAGKWENVKTPGANQVVVGDNIQVGWMVFPFPKENISLEMQGKDIELDPIEITALPSVLPMPELNVEGGLNQLIGGLGQLKSSLNKMGSAAQEIQRNQEKIANGCGQVAAGLGELEKGVKGAYEGSGQLAGGLEQLRVEHERLAQSNAQLTQQLMGLIASIEQANLIPENKLGELKQGIQGINQGLTDEETAINRLSGAASDLNNGLGKIHQEGIQPLAQQTPALSSGMKELAKGQEQLTGGLSAAENGVSTIKKETGGQFNELMRGKAVTDELEKLAGGYKSFMDNTNNHNSKVQFLLRTEGIEIDKPQAKASTEPTENTPWESIKRFFQNLFS